MPSNSLYDSIAPALRQRLSLWAVFFVVASTVGAVLFSIKAFSWQELETINSRFEARPWLLFSKTGLSRLNPVSLWGYHQAHEIPCTLWCWDYTLTWLLEDNHPPTVNKIVIFNHTLEDEPPQEAIKDHPWMEPLKQFPYARTTFAKVLDWLKESGAKLIILDCDFPQYSNGDKQLARAIHELSSGSANHPPIPILLVRTVNRLSTANMVGLEVPTKPSGPLEELSKLEPEVDVESKYTGISGVIADEDQVVRRMYLVQPSLTGKPHESIVLKAFKYLATEEQQKSIEPSSELFVDFSAPPNSAQYPVRPFLYLLDPERQRTLLDPPLGSKDVTLKGSVVIIGDSVVDVLSTPLANHGLNQMSGAEVLAHGLETLCRGQIPKCLSLWWQYAYLALVALIAGLIFSSVRQNHLAVQPPVFSVIASSAIFTRLKAAGRFLSEVSIIAMVVFGTILLACCLFTYCYLIVPVFVPAVSVTAGALVSVMWERERARQEAFKVKLEAAEDKLRHAQEKYELNLIRFEAESQAREIIQDQQRRDEFVKRINHDLNAPVTAINWTLSALQRQDRLDPDQTKDKIEQLAKNSDKLCELVDQIMQSYNYRVATDGTTHKEICDVRGLLIDCIELQQPLADARRSVLSWSVPEQAMLVEGSSLAISRVIDNLLRNALKHNPEGTKIMVKANVQDGNGKRSCALVDIIDNGKGIAPEHLQHIFEPGYSLARAKGEAPDRGAHEGLGLDIVKTLVEEMGGNVSVVSTVGEGSTFSFFLPIATKESDSNPSSSDVQYKDENT